MGGILPFLVDRRRPKPQQNTAMAESGVFPHNVKIAQVTIELKNHKQSAGHKDVTVKAVSDGDLSAGSRTNRRQTRGVGFA